MESDKDIPPIFLKNKSTERFGGEKKKIMLVSLPKQWEKKSKNFKILGPPNFLKGENPWKIVFGVKKKINV